ncbi:hypothetical protein LTR36_002642 [Oleoguttula mirabilis]|uniref:Uncharacterized protein n=1 Tax=Oleoguttula mirabilis TaxID=1507867 RepID=A0AAV9JL19_9PEZI|nr:hypothetical protein LTR36_002642 [Oleoguttula mirabilis]
MAEAPPTNCQRKCHVFAACGHAYLAPPCTCCSPTQQPLFHSFPSITSLRALTSFKQTKFKQQCPACQILTLDFQLEIAKQNYEDNRELWGDHDEDTIQDFKAFGKAGKTYQRLSMAIYRDSPNVTGWEQIYVGDLSH